jgi:hypothetical protein
VIRRSKTLAGRFVALEGETGIQTLLGPGSPGVGDVEGHQT